MTKEAELEGPEMIVIGCRLSSPCVACRTKYDCKLCLLASLMGSVLTESFRAEIYHLAMLVHDGHENILGTDT